MKEKKIKEKTTQARSDRTSIPPNPSVEPGEKITDADPPSRVGGCRCCLGRIIPDFVYAADNGVPVHVQPRLYDIDCLYPVSLDDGRNEVAHMATRQPHTSHDSPRDERRCLIWTADVIHEACRRQCEVFELDNAGRSRVVVDCGLEWNGNIPGVEPRCDGGETGVLCAFHRSREWGDWDKRGERRRWGRCKSLANGGRKWWSVEAAWKDLVEDGEEVWGSHVDNRRESDREKKEEANNERRCR